MRHTVLAVGSLVFALLGVASLHAHHSPTAIFDIQKRVAVTGTLSKIDWINPHIVLTMDARGEGGKVDHWTFESNPPSWYRGVEIARADFAKELGQTISVEALPARDGSLFGYMRKITLPDRTTLELVTN